MAVFSLNLQKKIEPRLVASGKFDGSHACIAAATTGGNILIHSPHRENIKLDEEAGSTDGRHTWSGEIAELQIGGQVTALCVGRFNDEDKDILFIGTSSRVLAYQVEDNSDIFYSEMTDGANCLAFGKLSWLSDKVVVVGGNGTVTALNKQGSPVFWTVVSDVVSAISLYDYGGHGDNELITGTVDFKLRVQKEDNVLWETKETAAITILAVLSGNLFAYAVANGTVGAYDSGRRLWRVKSKHEVMCMKSFDINGDAKVELLIGWSSGKVDGRISTTGEIMFKIQLSSTVVGLVEADYRKIGKPDLVVVSIVGEVRGYAVGSNMEVVEPEEIYQKLLAKKRFLQQELRQRSSSLPNVYMGNRLAIILSSKKNAVHVGLAAGPGLIIYAAVVFAEGIFKGETLVAHPVDATGEFELALRPHNNQSIDIQVVIFLGTQEANAFEVFEFTRQLPQFSMHAIIDEVHDDRAKSMSSEVTFVLTDRLERVALWLNQCLILNKELKVQSSGMKSDHIKLWLHDLRNDTYHYLYVEDNGSMIIKTNDIEFAGDVIQSLANYLGLRHLDSRANIPAIEEKMVENLRKLKGLTEIEVKLQAEAASNTTIIKNLIIRLEDAMASEEIPDIRRRLTQLIAVNGDLFREYEVRYKSYKEMTATIKELNIGVQNVARLRLGKPAVSTVARCRAAIQNGEERALILAIRHT